MRQFIQAFLVFLVIWIMLSGFTVQEFYTGAIVSIFLSFFLRKHISVSLSPRRWYNLLKFTPYYVYGEAIAHVKLVKMIFTLKVSPGLVLVPLKQKNDLHTTAIGNLITMTPGTFTLIAGEKDLLVHCIDMKKINAYSDAKELEGHVGKIL